MDLVARLAALGGAARAGDLAATGAQRRALTREVAAGQILDLDGCYALPGADAAVIAARRLGGFLTCASAAQAWRLSVPATPAHPHVAIPASRRSRLSIDHARCIVVHREAPALLTAQTHPDLPEDAGRLVVAPAEALARMLRCQPPMAAIAAVDSALNLRRCTVRDIDCLLVGPGSRRARALVGECDGRSQSAVESVARVALRRAGLCVEPAVWIAGVGFVDLLVEGQIVVELDGFAYHSGRAEYREDRRRDRELVAQGYLVLRFAWEDVMREGGAVVRAVRRVLAAPGTSRGQARH